jgi:1-acyl-sn-glycerol-3-phosphate acyltransferase
MSPGSAPRDAPNLLAGTLHGAPRDIVRAAFLALARPLLPLTIIDEEHVPRRGPLLVVCNHLSNADPIILDLVFPRPLFFMGKSELFRNPLFRRLLHLFGGFPVERGTPDRAALRHALRVLDHSIAVGIFPEGGRSRTGALTSALPGAGLLAIQSRAPVLPVAIYGTEFLPVNGEWPPSRPADVPRGATIRYGVPFLVPDQVDGQRVTPEEATKLIMLRIADLMPQRYRGPYAAPMA